MIKTTLLTVAASILTGCPASCYLASNQALPFTKDRIIKRFDEMDAALGGGEGYSKSNNDNGNFSWAQSYLLEAYLDMYEATKDIKYIKKFIEQSDNVIDRTDRARNLRDYRGRSLLAWSTTKYSRNNVRVVSLVDTGMITYPLSRFALLVNNDPDLYEFNEKANSYINVVVEALSVFDTDWNFEEKTGEGFYRFFDFSVENRKADTSQLKTISLPLPFNQQLAAGRSMIILCKLLEDSSFCQKSYALAIHFKNRLTLYGNGSYVWLYWYGEGLDFYSAYEDISHGAIDVDFAILAHKNGINIKYLDISRFIKTYNLNISRGGKIAASVYGTGEARPVFKEAIGRWLEIAEYDCKVWHDFMSLLNSHNHSEHPQVMLGIAKTAKYYEICARK